MNINNHKPQHQEQRKNTMILATTAVAAPDPVTVSPIVTYNNDNDNNNNKSPSALAWGIGIFVLGASAGLTIYTHRSQSWLRTMKQVNDNVIQKAGPPKYGPLTKQQYEKTRTRFDEEDIF
jgi:hypothetical protein